jgi:hypothetical protein
MLVSPVKLRKQEVGTTKLRETDLYICNIYEHDRVGNARYEQAHVWPEGFCQMSDI